MNKLTMYKHLWFFSFISVICILGMLYYLHNNRSDIDDIYIDRISKNFNCSDPNIGIKEFLSSDPDLIFCYWNQSYGRLRVLKLRKDVLDIYLVKAKKAIMYENTDLKKSPNSFASLFYDPSNKFTIEWKHSVCISDDERTLIMKYKNHFVKNTKAGYESFEDNKSHTSLHKYWDHLFVLTNGKMFAPKCSFDKEQYLTNFFLKYFEEYKDSYPDGWNNIMEYYYQ